jgi:hypothetical protein
VQLLMMPQALQRGCSWSGLAGAKVEGASGVQEAGVGGIRLVRHEGLSAQQLLQEVDKSMHTTAPFSRSGNKARWLGASIYPSSQQPGWWQLLGLLQCRRHSAALSGCLIRLICWLSVTPNHDDGTCPKY